jgi:hypothetical protein
MSTTRTAAAVATLGCFLAWPAGSLTASSPGLGSPAASSREVGSPGLPDPGHAHPALGCQRAPASVVPPSNPAVASSLERLSGVTSLSASNAWAVGSHRVRSQDNTFIRHWNGSAWSTVPSTNPGGAAGSTLSAVDAVSAAAVWAVGGYATESGSKTLVERWTGSQWIRVPSPSPPGGELGSTLRAVSAVSADEIWAAGRYDPPGPIAAATLVERWNGTRWTVIATPAAKLDRVLLAVSARAGDDVWAVGYEDDGNTVTTLVMHWDGKSWTRIPSIDPSNTVNVLRGVTVVAPGDVWMVGSSTTAADADVALLEHYADGKITLGRGPELGGSGSPLFATSGTSTTNTWAVGFQTLGWLSQTLTLHWDGRRWSRIDSPNVGDCAELRAVTARAPGSTWAVGSQANQTDRFALTERWNGKAWVVR